MFDLVNDVAQYPSFLNWCSGARVEASSPDEMTASIDVGLAGLSQTFRTRNELTPPAGGQSGRIVMNLLAGPFRRLEGGWTFDPSADGGCDVSLALDYELSSTPLRFVLSSVFEEITRSQVDAFVRRADEVYRDG